MNIKETKKILVYDIETAGVNALKADLGYVICFGYKWLDEKETHAISIDQFPKFKKSPHDDTELLKAALKILNQADGIVAHYGNRFDRPYLNARMLRNNLVFPEVSQLDPCWLSWKRFNLSSNRLDNVAKFFKCKNRKFQKNDGWPKWWLEVLKGSDKYQSKMRMYCMQDVKTLAEIAEKIRPFWPDAFTNRLYPKESKEILGRVCKKCQGTKMESSGIRVYQRTLCTRLRCRTCGFNGNYEKRDI